MKQCLVLLSSSDCLSVWQKSSHRGVSECGKSTQQDLDNLTSSCALAGSAFSFVAFFFPAIFMALLNNENVCRIKFCILLLNGFFFGPELEFS